MEQGFYHPERGYWQAIGGADLSKYPQGTIVVPVRPSNRHEWRGNGWVNIPETPEEAAAARAKKADSVLAAINGGDAALSAVTDALLAIAQGMDPTVTRQAFLDDVRARVLDRIA